MGFWQCLPFSFRLRGKYCWRPIAIMGVVDHFGPSSFLMYHHWRTSFVWSLQDSSKNVKILLYLPTLVHCSDVVSQGLSWTIFDSAWLGLWPFPFSLVSAGELICPSSAWLATFPAWLGSAWEISAQTHHYRYIVTMVLFQCPPQTEVTIISCMSPLVSYHH